LNKVGCPNAVSNSIIHNNVKKDKSIFIIFVLYKYNSIYF